MFPAMMNIGDIWRFHLEIFWNFISNLVAKLLLAEAIFMELAE